MLKEKDLLIEEIIENLEQISDNRNTVAEVKSQLAQHGISGGSIERIFSNPDTLKNVDIRELMLFAEQVYLKTGLLSLDPEEWFTKSEIKEARQFDLSIYEEDAVTLPAILENVALAGNNVYSTTIDVKTIAQWMKSQVLNYNFEIQRQPSKSIRKNTVIERPTVYKKNVKEIKELMLKGELVVTTLALNAAMQTSDVGEELTYNDKNKTLTINSGTRMDILDGFHRCLASLEAFSANPDINFKFIVIISNYTTKQAQQYQAQLAKATPISKTRIKELEANRHADTVVQQLRSDSELRGRISSSHLLNRSTGELVSYSVLSDAIDREFKMKARVDTIEVSQYLGEFFDYLIGLNQEVFLNNTNKNESLMNYNKMFAGYVALAAKMKKEDVRPQMVAKVLEQVDFSKSNPVWREIGMLNENLNISNKLSEEKIAKYFRSLNINNI